jgi:hypothetical protein
MNSKMIVINSGLAWMVNLVICLHFELDFFYQNKEKKGEKIFFY